MHNLQINLSKEEQQRASSRAAELGYPTIEAYVLALIAADNELPISDELEAELVKSLATPAREFTPADWDQKRRQLIERHRQAKAG